MSYRCFPFLQFHRNTYTLIKFFFSLLFGTRRVGAYRGCLPLIFLYLIYKQCLNFEYYITRILRNNDGDITFFVRRTLVDWFS